MITSPNTVYTQNYRNNYNLCVLISVFYDMDIANQTLFELAIFIREDIFV